MLTHHSRLRELFIAACDLPEQQQAAWVDENCSEDTQLRFELLRLLRTDASDHGILAEDKITEGIRFSFDTIVETELPKRIGQYQVKRVLGEGGMGVVYLAQQQNPNREVAVKVIRSSMASPDLLKRFEFEAEALGRLAHSGIARIHEAGIFVDTSTAHGRPFLAMEYIDGRSLRDHIQQTHPGTRDRLSLFVKICDAVHHAHLRGVIHRDLKPGNVMVKSDGQPAILDFGVARAIGSDLETSTLQTRAGQLIGTLQYMSPEQATGHALDVDTRSDVYSLGVIAYELLTGQLPYEVRDLNYLKAVRTIAEDFPVPLATIDRKFRGDLNTIVLKALEKRPEHRYQTALDLSSDLQRFLNREPIMARRMGTVDRVWKWCQRNTAVSTLLGMLALAIVLGLVGITRQTLSALNSKRLAEDAAQRAVNSAQRTERALDLLVSSFRSPDPTIEGRDVKMLDVLMKAVSDLEGDLTEDPLLKARLLHAIGESMQGLGIFDQGVRVHKSALQIRTRELGEEHPDTMASMANLAAMHFRVGDHDEALRLFIRSTALRTEVLGEEHPDTLKSMNDLAVGYRATGNWDESIKLRERTLQIMQRTLGPTHLDTIKAMVNVAYYYVLQGEYDQALPIAKEARRLSKSSLGEQHPTTINSLHLLATIYDAVRPVREYLPLQLEVLAQNQHVLGEDHPKTLLVMVTTAAVYLKNDNELEAIRLLEMASPILQKKLGENHETSIACKVNLGHAYLLADRPKDALEMLEEVDRLTPSSILSQDQKSQGRLFLAEALLRTGQPQKGIAILEQVLQLNRSNAVDAPVEVADALAKTSYAYLNAGMSVEAEPYLRESFDLLRANTMPDNLLQLAVQSALGASLSEQGKREEAEPLLLSGGRGLLAERVEPPYPSPREVANALRRIIRFYELTEQPYQADKWGQTLRQTIQENL